MRVSSLLLKSCEKVKKFLDERMTKEHLQVKLLEQLRKHTSEQTASIFKRVNEKKKKQRSCWCRYT